MRFLAPFTLLGAIGLVGVASLIPTLGPALEKLRSLPNPPARSDAGLIGLVLLQPSILVLLAVAVGVLLADRAGLQSYLLAWSRGMPLPGKFSADIPVAIGSALAVGTAIIILDLIFKEVMEPGSIERLDKTAVPPHWALRASAILYGGVTEELMLRFGLMTLLVWLASFALPGTFVRHPDILIGTAILLSALLFGLGHLPKLFAMTQPSTGLVLHIVLLNTLAGLVYGWLYWRYSLEHAMMAHALTHVTFWAITPLLLRLA